MKKKKLQIMNVQLFVEITEYRFILDYIFFYSPCKIIIFFLFFLDHTVYLLQLYVRVHESLCIKVTWLYGNNFILFLYLYSLIMMDFFLKFEEKKIYKNSEFFFLYTII